MDRLDVFRTPIHVVDLRDMGAVNDAVRAALVAEAEALPSVARSNVGGWHSEPDLTRRDGPFPVLMRRIAAEIDRVVHDLALAAGVEGDFRCGYSIQAWAMVLRAGHYVMPHDHADAHFSGAFYVDAGDPPAEPGLPGRIVFTNPITGQARIPGLDLFPSNLTIQPRTGMLIVFPGYVSHYVHPYQGERPRICVSFNVRVGLESPTPA